VSRTPFELHVECHAGYRADEEPRRLRLGTREVEVVDVLDRWLDPAHRYFKLLGDDGAVYILRQDTNSDRWELTLFDRGESDETRLSST
jgi:hypothetical protein